MYYCNFDATVLKVIQGIRPTSGLRFFKCDVCGSHFSTRKSYGGKEYLHCDAIGDKIPKKNE